MKSFTELQAWKTGMELMKDIHLLTKTFPAEEKFGITQQMRRASTSILANLAEGFSRRTAADKAHKYTIARGECSELLAFLYMSMELGYIPKEKEATALALTERTGKLLSGLIHAHFQ